MTNLINVLSNELPLLDYIQLYGNFNPDYISSSFYPAGYFDSYNLDTVDFEGKADQLSTLEKSRYSFVKSANGHTTFDLLFKPPAGILNSSQPLLPKTEMMLSFDRAPAELSLINKTSDYDSPLAGQAIELSHVFMRAEYYSTPKLRNLFSTIATKEISYKYDELSVYQKNLPQGTNIIRLANLIGGNTPQYLFAGVIESDAITGDFLKCSTAFKRHGVKEFDLTLDGYSVHGFPLTSEDNSPIGVYDKFIQTTNRKFDSSCPKQMLIGDFLHFHYIYAHKFEGETSDNGWLGINLKLDLPDGYKENYTQGIKGTF